jgi:hypothetical protein
MKSNLNITLKWSYMKPLLNKYFSIGWMILFAQMVLIKTANAQSAYSHLAYKQAIDTIRAPTPLDLNKMYKTKATTNTILGIVALTSGMTMVIVGAEKNLQANLFGDYVSPSNDGVWLIVFGSLMAISSKIFFTAARHNRINAKLALQPERLSMGNSSMYKSGYMALSLKISF